MKLITAAGVRARDRRALLRLAARLCLALSVALVACTQQKTTLAASADTGSSPAPAGHIEIRVVNDDGGAASFNKERAMRYVKEIVALGPRPIGSANHKKVEDYIHAHLNGDEVEDDSFNIDTSEGKFPVHNIIAKYPGTK